MDTKLLKGRAPDHTQFSVRVTPQEAKAIDVLVRSGFFLNRADFVRSAVREKLSLYQEEPLRMLTREQAEQEILGYLRFHPVAYPSDIAAELRLDLEMTMEIVRDLMLRKKIAEAVTHGHA